MKGGYKESFIETWCYLLKAYNMLSDLEGFESMVDEIIDNRLYLAKNKVDSLLNDDWSDLSINLREELSHTLDTLSCWLYSKLEDSRRIYTDYKAFLEKELEKIRNTSEELLPSMHEVVQLSKAYALRFFESVKEINLSIDLILSHVDELNKLSKTNKFYQDHIYTIIARLMDLHDALVEFEGKVYAKAELLASFVKTFYPRRAGSVIASH